MLGRGPGLLRFRLIWLRTDAIAKIDITVDHCNTSYNIYLMIPAASPAQAIFISHLIGGNSTNSSIVHFPHIYASLSASLSLSHSHSSSFSLPLSHTFLISAFSLTSWPDLPAYLQKTYYSYTCCKTLLIMHFKCILLLQRNPHNKAR